MSVVHAVIVDVASCFRIHDQRLKNNFQLDEGRWRGSKNFLKIVCVINGQPLRPEDSLS